MPLTQPATASRLDLSRLDFSSAPRERLQAGHAVIPTSDYANEFEIIVGSNADDCLTHRFRGLMCAGELGLKDPVPMPPRLSHSSEVAFDLEI